MGRTAWRGLALRRNERTERLSDYLTARPTDAYARCHGAGAHQFLQMFLLPKGPAAIGPSPSG